MAGLAQFWKESITRAGGGGKRREMFNQGALTCGDLTTTEKDSWKVCGFPKPEKAKKEKKPKGKLFDAITGK